MPLLLLFIFAAILFVLIAFKLFISLRETRISFGFGIALTMHEESFNFWLIIALQVLTLFVPFTFIYLMLFVRE